MRAFNRAFSFCCTALAISSTISVASAQDSQYPYTAYVSVDAAYIRSGPGKRYYPTDKLKRGDAVEVYREDPGGWLAIRPPAKSFSWVPADALQPTKDKLAVVTGDRVASHVGSRVGDSHNVIQVRLERGEEVEIVAAEAVTTDGRQELWCKISPPSGEFRWIYGRFIDRTKPVPVAPIVASISPAPTAPVATGPSAADVPHPVADASAPGADAAASGSFESNLTAVDLALSAMVVQDMSIWKFDDLERRGERVLDQAQASDQREHAKQLLDRIAKFADVKHRSDAVALLGTGLDRSRLQLTAMTTPPATTLPSLSSSAPIATMPSPVVPPGAASRYDAVGKLTSVRSQRPNAPPFALIDASGLPVAFVTPAPGVNLQPMLGHQIGVSGSRGYMPEFQKPHITAMLADPLDGSDVIMALRDDMKR